LLVPVSWKRYKIEAYSVVTHVGAYEVILYVLYQIVTLPLILTDPNHPKPLRFVKF